MTRARTVLAAVVIAAATVPLTAAPASAHVTYCGHGTTRHFYPWPHTVTWLASQRAADGSHRHLVRAEGRLESGTRTWITCPTTVLTGY